MVTRIVVVCCLVVFAETVSAQESLETYTADEVVVTATRAETPVDRIPQPVTVIGLDEIAASSAMSLGEMLDTVPGIRVISAGSAGRPQGISIRSLNGGFSSNKVLVLVDGRPVNDGWYGGVDWHAVPLEQVARVEVMRGPGSALYGSQASAGVISIITSTPAPGLHGRLTLGREVNAAGEVAAGRDGYGRADVSSTRMGLTGSFGGERASHAVTLSYHQAAEAFPSPYENGWDDYNLLYRVTGELSPSIETSLALSVSRNAWENSAERAPTKVTDDRASADIGARWQTGDGVVNGSIYVNRFDGANRVIATGLKTGQKVDRIGLIADYTQPILGGGIIVAGVDLSRDDAEVTADRTVVSMVSRGIETVYVPDNATATTDTVLASTFDGVYGSGEQTCGQYNLAAYVQYTHSFGSRLTLVAGGRLDSHSDSGTIVNPQAGIAWRVFDHPSFPATIKANYGAAFRAPPMWMLFSRALDGYGDPGLDPERTRNTDIGIYQRLGTLGFAEITFFHMDVSDLLTNDKSGATGEGYYVFVPHDGAVDTLSFNRMMNLGSYSPKGVEVAWSVRPHRQITITGAYTYLDPGNFTFQTSRHRATFGVDGYCPAGPNRIEASFDYTYTGDGYFFDYEQRPFDAFSLSAARLSFRRHDTTRLSIQVKNLFDETYRLWHYAWQPGRSLVVTLETGF